MAGGPENGYKYVVDSNYDWGQDMYNLQEFVEENNIDQIKLDYFGGANPLYYLEDNYVRFNPRNPHERHGWIAVSATLMMNGRGEATKDFQEDTTYYEWIEQYEPVARAGNSIFIYYIE